MPCKIEAGILSPLPDGPRFSRICTISFARKKAVWALNALGVVLCLSNGFYRVCTVLKLVDYGTCHDVEPASPAELPSRLTASWLESRDPSCLPLLQNRSIVRWC